MKNDTKIRSANLDALRIFSMLLIVLLHTIDHSGVLEQEQNYGNAIYLYIRYIYALCQVCVNIYVMLSGYFLVTSRFKLSKIITLWMSVAFYSFTFKLIFMLCGIEDFSIVSLASCIFPIFTGRYWFITIYVGMYLLFPFLNTLIHSLDKRKHTLLVLVLFLIMSLWSSIHPMFAGMNSGGGWGLAWFVVLYITAAWFRLYYSPTYKPIKWILGYIAIPLCIALLFCPPLSNILPGFIHRIVANWYSYDSAPVFIMTILLFVGFLNIKFNNKVSKAICKIAPLTLGVYLIHAHANVDPWMWSILQLPQKMDSMYFPLIQIASMMLIFFVCIGIEAIRKSTIGKLENAKFLSTICNKIYSYITFVTLKFI